MSIEYNFTCTLKNGIHARPASHLEKLCNSFISEITWINQRNQIQGDAKSVLSLIGTNTLANDKCVLVVSGIDEEQALESISNFIEHDLDKCDSDLEENKSEVIEDSTLPRSLIKTEPSFVKGKAVIHGVGVGKLKPIDSFNIDTIVDGLASSGTVDYEAIRFERALKQTIGSIEDKLVTCSDTEKDILGFQVSFLKDADFIKKVEKEIISEIGCLKSINKVIKEYRNSFRNAESNYLKERELDVIDVAYKLISFVDPELLSKNELKLTEKSICIADNMTPGQFIDMDKTFLKGLVLSHAGETSHTIILARSFGIPTVIGVDFADVAFLENKEIILDGNFGIIIHDISENVRRYYNQEINVQSKLEKKQKQSSYKPGLTHDGKLFEIAANIASGVEAEAAFKLGADGIGLFRTEMLYMDRPAAPSEDELFKSFSEAVTAANGKPVIIRTMDIGGDKPAEFINIGKEHNPFLGYRGVRIYQEFNQLFQEQLRAILKVTTLGPVKIMVPMVCSYDEVVWIKLEIERAKESLFKEGWKISNNYQVGIMIEVPSIMFIIDQCCELLDFFSIGSNDLTQYLMAVDRDNSNVGKYYNCFNPAFIRALKHIVDTVHKHGKWVGLCGEMGGVQKALPLLVGLGLDEISMSGNVIARTKEEMSKLDSNLCQSLLGKVCNSKTTDEVETLLEAEEIQIRDDKIITIDCISIDAEYQNKEEAIKGMVDKIYLAGRCKNRYKLIDDLWAREDAYTTDIGFGFAIPHSKSEQMRSNTISICRLAKPIDWGNTEVSVIVMLTLKKELANSNDNEHMKIFSKLAKKIMNQGFRDQIYNAHCVEDLNTIFNENLA